MRRGAVQWPWRRWRFVLLRLDHSMRECHAPNFTMASTTWTLRRASGGDREVSGIKVERAVAMAITRSGEHGPVSKALTEVTRHNQGYNEVGWRAVALYVRWQGRQLKNDGTRRGEAVATMAARPNSASERAAKVEGIRASEGER
jgi:hypothetical protein